MSELFEFISIEYSFREINFRGIQLLEVSQEHNIYRPVSRPLAVSVRSETASYKKGFLLWGKVGDRRRRMWG
jgi:hypothetical protein